MDLSNLRPAKGSIKAPKRIGRGEGSGRGGTSTRGHKGQKSRSGYSRRIGFEGGQMPLYRRVPKFGFKNLNRVEYQVVNLKTIQELVENNNLTSITPEILRKHGLVSKHSLIKILGDGELKAKLDIKAHGFSKSAVKAIEEAGGSIEKL